MNDPDVELYFDILNGKCARFPGLYWDSEKGKERAIKLGKILFKGILNMKSGQEALTKTGRRAFADHKLITPLMSIYHNSMLAYLKDIYPGEHIEYPRNMKPVDVSAKDPQYKMGYLQKVHRFIYNSGWDEDYVRANLDSRILFQNGLDTGLRRYYVHGPSKVRIVALLNDLYPGSEQISIPEREQFGIAEGIRRLK